MSFTIRMMAAIALQNRVDSHILHIVKDYANVLSPSELTNAKLSPWMTLYKVANDMNERGQQQMTLESLAGDHLHTAINQRLQTFVCKDMPPLIAQIGGDASVAFKQYEEGLISESELLMKILDILSHGESNNDS